MDKEDMLLDLIKQGKFKWKDDYDLVGPNNKEYYKTNCNKYKARTFIFGKRKYTCLVHRIAYRFFKGSIPQGMTINHINGNRLDNNPDNLEVLSLKDNTLHSLDSLGNRALLSLRARGILNPNAKFTEVEVARIRAEYISGATIRGLGRKWCMTYPCMCSIVKNRSYFDESYEKLLKSKVQPPKGAQYKHTLSILQMTQVAQEHKFLSYSKLAVKYSLNKDQVIRICRKFSPVIL